MRMYNKKARKQSEGVFEVRTRDKNALQQLKSDASQQLGIGASMIIKTPTFGCRDYIITDSFLSKFVSFIF